MVDSVAARATAFACALKALADEGLNWVAFVPAGTTEAAAPAGYAVHGNSGLLLFLALGSRFGSKTSFDERVRSDAFDARSARLVQCFIDEHLLGGDPQASIVYPGAARLDLRRWLESGRVQYRSRLGIGIRPDCGPWLAVRAAVWTRSGAFPLPSLEKLYPALPEGPSPCDECAAASCIEACPPEALPRASAPERASESTAPGGARLPVRRPETSAGRYDLPQRFLTTCSEYRLASKSPCARRCLARLACPIGREFRYPEAQLRYHYDVSLRSLRRWREGARGGGETR